MIGICSYLCYSPDLLKPDVKMRRFSDVFGDSLKYTCTGEDSLCPPSAGSTTNDASGSSHGESAVHVWHGVQNKGLEHFYCREQCTYKRRNTSELFACQRTIESSLFGQKRNGKCTEDSASGPCAAIW